MQNSFKYKAILKGKSLNFSRWSRKAYAAFISIGKEVKISALKIRVAQGFIKKATSANIISVFFNLSTEDKYNEEPDALNCLNCITLINEQTNIAIKSAFPLSLNLTYSLIKTFKRKPLFALFYFVKLNRL